MRIWFDGQCFQSTSRFRGIGRYSIELLRALKAAYPAYELRVSLNGNMMDEALLARDLLADFLDPEEICVWYGLEDGGETHVGQSPARQISEVALLHHIACLEPDIAVSLSSFEGDAVPLSPFLPGRDFPVPTAAIFYDIIPHRLPRLYLTHAGYSLAYRRRFEALRDFDGLLAISDYAKSEAIAVTGGQDSTYGISAGLSPAFLAHIDMPVPPRVTATLMPDKKNVLYVGGLDQRKNLGRVVEALALLPEALRNGIRFVIAGDPMASELHALAHAWIGAGLKRDNLVLHGFASDRELVGLYKTADVLIQPSLLEGFGLTALEAMFCGTPVIAANTGALPELVAAPDLLFDPENPAAIAARLEWVLANPAATKPLVASAQKRAEAFTWARTAQRTSKALALILASSRKAPAQRESLRELSAARVRKVDIAPATAAFILSAAEPVVPRHAHLFVDISSTARIDHKSGIQRVVRKVFESLPSVLGEAGASGYDCIATDNELGFFKAGLSEDDEPWDAQRGHHVRFGTGDTVLMLDSSWEFHTVHKVSLQQARLAGARIVSVLYDLVPIQTPGFCHSGMPPVFSAWLQAALSYSDAVVCISKAVADQFTELLHAMEFPRKIDVGYWHLGADFHEVEDASVKKAGRKAAGDRLIFLVVGTLEPRKGHAVILDAFEQLWAEGLDVELHLVGRPGWNIANLTQRLENHPELGKRLFWESNASDADLADCYAKSDAVITASYAEGFGLPIIEAMHLGKLIIATDLPVFREVAGDGGSARFFKSGSSSDLARAVRSAIPGLPADLPKSLGAGASWIDSTRDLLDVVMKDGWQSHYVPDEAHVHAHSGTIGRLTMTRPLTPQEMTRYAIEQLGVAELDAGGSSIRLTLRISNLGDRTWWSRGPEDDRLGVKVAVLVTRPDGKPVRPRPVLYPLAFAVPARQSVIVLAEVSVADIHAGGVSAIIDLVQEGAGIFGSPLHVALGGVFEDDNPANPALQPVVQKVS